MRSTSVILAVIVAAACAIPTSAREPRSRDARQVDPLRRIDSPLSSIPFAEGYRLTEGPRMLGDTFPYMAAAPETVSGTLGREITTGNLREFLRKSPQEGGHQPAAIRTGDAAIEAVRLFVCGPLVRTPEAGERLVATGRRMKDELEHLEVEINDHRPATWLPTATPLPQDRSIHPTEAWAVSMVALEVDRYLQLVHVEARVRANGEIDMTRKPIVAGPMTSWQTASIGPWTEGDERADRAMREEAARARREYAKALGGKRDLDTMWVLARVFRSADLVAEFVGEPELRSADGSMCSFRLTDGTFVRFETRPSLPTLVTHLAANAEGRPGEPRLKICR